MLSNALFDIHEIFANIINYLNRQFKCSSSILTGNIIVGSGRNGFIKVKPEVPQGFDLGDLGCIFDDISVREGEGFDFSFFIIKGDVTVLLENPEVACFLLGHTARGDIGHQLGIEPKTDIGDINFIRNNGNALSVDLFDAAFIPL